MTPETLTYDPLAYENLGNSVVGALLSQEAIPLNQLVKFQGAGIYVIYYSGDFLPYLPLAKRNQNQDFSLPIYAGKAIPKGARKGGRGLSTGYPLYNRLTDHKESIILCETTLNIEHFYCRYLVVTDVWIPMAESMLIGKYKPIWNVVIEGFGNHDPGSGREKGQKPIWDTVHPGRPWAKQLPSNRLGLNEIMNKLEIALSDV